MSGCHVYGPMCSLCCRCICSYVFVILLISLTRLTSITGRHGTDVSSVPVDTNKSKHLEGETSETKIRAKQPPGYYLCHETFTAIRKSIMLLQIPLLQDFTYNRRILSQSFLNGDDSPNKEKAQGRYSSLTLAASFPSKKGREERGRKPTGMHGL